MKGKVQYQTPWRQYEYLKITIEFNDEQEKERAVEMAISDCQRYKNILPIRDAEDKKKGTQGEVPVAEMSEWDKSHGVTDKAEVDGMKGRKIKGVWEWYDNTSLPYKWEKANEVLADLFEGSI